MKYVVQYREPGGHWRDMETCLDEDGGRERLARLRRDIATSWSPETEARLVGRLTIEWAIDPSSGVEWIHGRCRSCEHVNGTWVVSPETPAPPDRPDWKCIACGGTDMEWVR